MNERDDDDFFGEPEEKGKFDEFFGDPVENKGNDDFFGEPAKGEAAAQTPDQDYEKLSYGKVAYRRVQKLRRKGAKRGIQVPVLGYQLSKPDKPRIAFWIFAIISAVVFVGAIVGLGFMYDYIARSLSPTTGGIMDVLKSIFNPQTLMLSLGLSSIAGIFIFLIYLMLILLLAIPVLLVFAFYGFVRKTFYFAVCSKEEFAVGGIVTSFLTNLVIFLVLTTVFMIVGAISIKGIALVILGVLYAALVLIFGFMAGMMIYERRKCKEWFSTLSAEKRENYLAHERALKRVKRRLSDERQMWESMFK